MLVFCPNVAVNVLTSDPNAQDAASQAIAALLVGVNASEIAINISRSCDPNVLEVAHNGPNMEYAAHEAGVSVLRRQVVCSDDAAERDRVEGVCVLFTTFRESQERVIRLQSAC